jgi:23S rRNA (cytosine1962-C5)-methyltransferase
MEDILDIQRDHVVLINQVMDALTVGGVLYFSTNYTRFQLEQDALRAAVVKDITKATTSFDFEGKLKRQCFRMVK